MTNKHKVGIIYEIFGWYGLIAILLAYGLVSYRILVPTGFIYQLLNLTGAAGIIVISYKKKVLQSVVLNIVWGLIGLIAIIQLFF